MAFLYSYTKTSLEEPPDDVFETRSDVRQGGPESPMLFNLYVDFVMRTFLKDCKVAGIKFINLEYRIP